MEQEGLRKGAACKHWLLFKGLDQASYDLSGTADETVEIITTNTPGANEYTTLQHLQQLNFGICIRFLVHFGKHVKFPALRHTVRGHQV